MRKREVKKVGSKGERERDRWREKTKEKERQGGTEERKRCC